MDKEHTQEKRSSLRDLAYVFFRRKWVILGVFLSTVIPVTVYMLLIPPLYEATARLLVKPGRENIYVSPVGSPEGMHPPTIIQRVSEVINSEIQIIESRVLIRRVVEEMGVARLFPHMLLEDSQAADAKESLRFEAAVNRALHDLSAERVKATDVIEVGFKSYNPDMSANFIDRLIDLYLERHLEVHQSGQSYEFFRTQSAQLEQKLKTAARRLADFKKRYGIVSFNERKDLTLSKYMGVNAAIKDNDTAIKETQKRIEKFKEDLTEISEHKYLSQDQSTDPPVISTLKQRLAELELRKTELVGEYKQDNFKVVSIDNAIAKAREMLAGEEEKFHGSVSTGLSATYQQIEAELLVQEANMAAFSSRGAELGKHLIKYGQELERLGRLEPELRALERDVSVQEQNYRLYLTKFEESRVSDAMDAARMVSVSVLEPATAPLRPIPVHKALNIIVSICIGGVAGLGLAFLIEYFDHTFKVPEDIKDNLKVPMLGTVADLPHEEIEDLEALAASAKPPANYELITSNIVMHAEEKESNVLSFCSPTSEEGSSTVAVGLAASLAKAHGGRVVLIDANFRHPVLHSRFNIPISPGFADVVDEGADVHEATRQSVVANLFVLTCGTIPPNPMAILESPKLVDLIEILRREFHWIIFDCAPINLYPDSSVLASRLDGTVLVIQAEDKRAEVAIQAKERLEQAGAKILGAVLNRRRYAIPEIVYRGL